MKYIFIALAALVSFLSASASNTAENDSVTHVTLKLFSNKVLYENLTPEEKNEFLKDLPEDKLQHELRTLAINLAIFEYLESEEDGFVTLNISREDLLNSGITEAEYDQIQNDLKWTNSYLSEPQGKWVRGVTPEQLVKHKKERREFRKRFEGKE